MEAEKKEEVKVDHFKTDDPVEFASLNHTGDYSKDTFPTIIIGQHEKGLVVISNCSANKRMLDTLQIIVEYTKKQMEGVRT